jgi:hypothetical protein
MPIKDKIQKGFMHGMGKYYELLYKLPLGEKIVRTYTRGLGKLIFYSPGSGARRQKNIDGVRKILVDMCSKMNFNLELIKESIKPSSFEFYVNECPYNFNRSDQQGVCDAAMDMDREMFRLIGGELIILESTVKGAPKCRILMKWIEN